MTAQRTGAAGDESVWDALPDTVRGRLAELAAKAVGELPKVDVPQRLRAVARFTPAKRARRGAHALLTELRDSSAFRSAVVRWWQDNNSDALDPNAEDTVAATAAAVLLGEPDAAERVGLLAERAEQATLREQRDTAIARVARLETEMQELRAKLADAQDAVHRVRAEREAEVERLRGRLREQGKSLRDARDAAEAGESAAERVRAELAADLDALRAERDAERERAEQERGRAERARADAEVARQSAREARQADEVRLALLVDTVDGAITGLRRELALGSPSGIGSRPADQVRGASIAASASGRVDDPVALDRLLALPSVHMVVDGYNVTKTGYPELALADQRDRLVHQLAALASRTGAEVTVVFDGAGVVAVPTATPKGVRVLFSDPGVLADDVIRALVAAEPEGRPVVVVTSDRAVADSVWRRGAHPVPSAVLLTRLGRV
ncbi:MAG: RNA-binding protein [Pseudonocardiaceae bacterium]|nr:RNA-binding protein [Pseudonocardiaceae bacterium]